MGNLSYKKPLRGLRRTAVPGTGMAGRAQPAPVRLHHAGGTGRRIHRSGAVARRRADCGRRVRHLRDGADPAGTSSLPARSPRPSRDSWWCWHWPSALSVGNVLSRNWPATATAAADQPEFPRHGRRPPPAGASAWVLGPPSIRLMRAMTPACSSTPPHNDWLEWLDDGGPLVVAAMLWLALQHCRPLSPFHLGTGCAGVAGPRRGGLSASAARPGDRVLHARRRSIGGIGYSSQGRKRFSVMSARTGSRIAGSI